MKTEVVDVNLIDIPDPRLATPAVAIKLSAALASMNKRRSGGLVEEALVECHSYERALEIAARPIVLPAELRQQDRRNLDEAVFELLGVQDAKERTALVDRLYNEVAGHFRAIRVTEIQKMEDRTDGGKQEFKSVELAADAWDALDLDDVQPIAAWLSRQTDTTTAMFEIPADRPVVLAAGSIFEGETVYFGKRRKRHIVCRSREVAELVLELSEMGFHGTCVLPTEPVEAARLLHAAKDRHTRTIGRITELVASRASDPNMQLEILGVMTRWFVLGKAQEKAIA